MDNKIILLGSLLLASSTVLAESSLLEATGKQLIKEKATQLAPNALKQLDAASQALDTAKSLKAVTPAATLAPSADLAAKPAEPTIATVPETSPAAPTVPVSTETVTPPAAAEAPHQQPHRRLRFPILKTLLCKQLKTKQLRQRPLQQLKQSMPPTLAKPLLSRYQRHLVRQWMQSKPKPAKKPLKKHLIY
jgi:hypothetical protein